MQALRSSEQIRDVNTRYHDVAAAGYDEKWGIDFGATGRGQVLGKVRKLLGDVPGEQFQSAVEVGAGTGYFGLNLMRAGLIRELTCTDISSGMLSALSANADRLELTPVTTVQAAAESLPLPDASFDLVLGHAVLHHLPDLGAAFSEFFRVLRPGGTILFAGEPSLVGDRVARVPKRASRALAPLWRLGLGATAAQTQHTRPRSGDHQLEGEVDIHAFSPGALARLVQRAGFTAVAVRGEELLANWFGWFNRGLEATADPDAIPMWWRQYAFRGYLWLQVLDRHLLEPRLPPAIFYNLLLSARRPLEA